MTTTITGIIFAVKDNNEFWIQDKDAGIFCYNITLQTAPVVGAQVTFEVTATASYHGLIQVSGITASSDSVQSTGNKPYVVDMTAADNAFTSAMQAQFVRYTGTLASGTSFTFADNPGAIFIRSTGGADFSTGRTGVWVGPIGEYDAPQFEVLGIDYFLMN